MRRHGGIFGMSRRLLVRVKSQPPHRAHTHLMSVCAGLVSSGAVPEFGNRNAASGGSKWSGRAIDGKKLSHTSNEVCLTSRGTRLGQSVSRDVYIN